MMRIPKLFCLVLVLMVLVSCSPQKKLARQYMGEGREVVVGKLGEPTQENRLENGQIEMIYIKETYIRSTPVSTGRFTLDPMISPGFLKIQKKIFVLDRLGLVISTNFVEEIQR